MPRPKPLENMLIRRIHAAPLTAEQMRTVWVKLPMQERVLRAVVAAYYRFLRRGEISREEDGKIWDLTDAEPELGEWF